MKRNIFRNNIAVVLLFLLSIILFSCTRPTGYFAFKTFKDETYRRLVDPIEFKSTDVVDWIFLVKGIRESASIGVILQKKEIIWVDIHSAQKSVTMVNNAVYGSIKNLQPGEYRVIITELPENEKISTINFQIYTEEN